MSRDAKVLHERNKITCELTIEVIFVGLPLHFPIICLLLIVMEDISDGKRCTELNGVVRWRERDIF